MQQTFRAMAATCDTASSLPEAIEKINEAETTGRIWDVVLIDGLVLGSDGNLAGGCSTSGLGRKHPGRVGDSPILGGGLYVDNEVGAAGATGIGENIMRYCATFMIVEFMRQGMGPEEACLAMIQRILRIEKGKKNPSINFIALDRNGRCGGAGTNKGFKFAVTSVDKSEVLPNSAWSKIDFGATKGGG